MKAKRLAGRPNLDGRITFRVAPETMRQIMSLMDARGLVKVSDIPRIAIHEMLERERQRKPPR